MCCKYYLDSSVLKHSLALNRRCPVHRVYVRFENFLSINLPRCGAASLNSKGRTCGPPGLVVHLVHKVPVENLKSYLKVYVIDNTSIEHVKLEFTNTSCPEEKGTYNSDAK